MSAAALTGAGGAAAAGAPPTADPDAAAAVSAHRSALAAHSFFLAWLTGVAEEEARYAPATAAAAAAAAAGGRGSKKAAAAAAAADGRAAPFSWDAGRERVGRALGALADVDLWALFRPASPPDGLLVAWTATGTALLASPAGARAPAARDGAGRALAAAACRYGHLDQVAGALIDALRKTEHLPAVLADLAAGAAESAGGDDRLGRELLASVARADPAAFEGATPADTAAARAVGTFLVELTERLPRAVAAGFAPLVAHLGGRSHAIRSGIIGAAASLLHRAYGEGGGPGSDGSGTSAAAATGDPAAALARLRTKQHLLDLLVERAYDTSAFTRARALHAWAALADRGSLPLGHWLCVTRLAADRLEDRAALVRRAALGLLQALMLYNPFGPVLPAGSFDASLAQFEARLADAEGGRGGGAEDRPEAAAKWGAGAIKVEADGTAAGADAAARAAAEAAAADEMVDALVAGDDAEDDAQPSQEEEEEEEEGAPQPAPQDANAEQLRALVASLRTASAFARALTAALPTVVQLLGSATLSDVTEALSLLVCARKFELDGAEAALRRVLPLAFSREQGIPGAVVSAVEDLRLAGRGADAGAAGLVDLAVGASLGELAALEEVVGRLLAVPAGGTEADARARPAVVRALWAAAARAAAAVAGAGSDPAARAAALPRARAALALVSMAARSRPALVTDNMAALLAAGFGLRDGGCARHAAAALRAAAGAACGVDPAAFAPAHAPLVRLLLAPATDPKWGLPDEAWYGAADAGLRALLDCHPDPQGLGVALLRAGAAGALGRAETPPPPPPAPGGEDEMQVDVPAPPRPAPPLPRAGPVARLAFLAGGIALAQLVAADGCARAARRARAAAGAAADAVAGAADPASEDEDIAAQLGVGPAPGGEADLDALRDAAEVAVVGGAGAAAGALAPLLSALATAPGAPAAWRAACPALDASACLALAKLMAVDGAYCGAHLGALFSRVAEQEEEVVEAAAVQPAAAPVEAGGEGAPAPAAAPTPPPPPPPPTISSSSSSRLRGGLVVAAGDLAVRWPNTVEPWTAALYAPLDDACPAVRRDATMVLSHLVLNDMVKVKGHAGRLAARLVDPDPRVASLAGLFFHELAGRATKGSHPVYNMIPDVLSSLSSGPGALPPAAFQGVMKGLLGHVGKDRQADGLVDKLAGRMGADAEAGTVRGMAFCLGQLSLSEKGVRRVVELLPAYRAWLGEGEVVGALKAVAARARKLPKAGAPFKAEVEAWLAKVEEAAAEISGVPVVAVEEGEAAAPPVAMEGEAGAVAAVEGEAGPSGADVAAAPVADAVAAVRRMTLDGDGEVGAVAAPPQPRAAVAEEGEDASLASSSSSDDDGENDGGAANASPSPAKAVAVPTRGRRAAAKEAPAEEVAEEAVRPTRARRGRA